MRLNENFDTLKAYLDQEEIYTEQEKQALRDKYQSWFGVKDDEIVFTTSDDDYEFCRDIGEIIQFLEPNDDDGSERLFTIIKDNFEFQIAYEYVEGGLEVLTFKKEDVEKIQKIFQ